MKQEAGWTLNQFGYDGKEKIHIPAGNQLSQCNSKLMSCNMQNSNEI